mmetsp:Transcript_11493/g.19040  ORF Transcript_11493/g.19040 Transcript_11493/m.19040 type:complete len:185 (-) Transcript_11493:1885-2439(-)
MKHPTSSMIAALVLSSVGCNAFTSIASKQRPSTATWMSNTPATLVSQAAFVYGIDVLKADMGLEIIPDEQKPMYAIGKLDAELPLELVSGIRFSDCETVTLISQVRQDVADATGISSLDTIVAVRAGNDGEGNFAFESDVRESSIQNTAQAYTEAINFAMANSLPSIELEINRLVPMMPSQEDL